MLWSAKVKISLKKKCVRVFVKFQVHLFLCGLNNCDLSDQNHFFYGLQLFASRVVLKCTLKTEERLKIILNLNEASIIAHNVNITSNQIKKKATRVLAFH